MKKCTSTHQVFIKTYQKINKCINNCIPNHIIPNTLKEEDIDVKIEEIANDKDFNKSDVEIETYETIEELKYPQENYDVAIIILDDLNEREMNDPRVFKRSR